MNVQIVGQADERMVLSLHRRLLTDVNTGPPTDPDPYICVAVGDALPEAILDDPQVRLLVLVEPDTPLRDRVVRALAARTVPALEIVEHVAQRIQAERTWALLLALLMGVGNAESALRGKRIEASNLVDGPPSGGSWTGHVPVDPGGLSVGFLGFGPLAQGVAARARLSGMQVLYWPQLDEPGYLVDCEEGALRSGAEMASFPEVLAESDMLVLDLGFTADSIRIIDAAELALMRSGAYVVNTSHGRAIDEGALIQALRSGHLGGAALDRFNYEPLPADSPLLALDRVLLTPGIAVPDSDTVADETARQIAAALSVHTPEVKQRVVRRQVQRKRKT